MRYRFYVSSAILTARGSQAASVRRVSAPEVEESVVAALRERFPQAGEYADSDLIAAYFERIVLIKSKISISLRGDEAGQSSIELAQPPKPRSIRARIETDNCHSTPEPETTLVHAVSRALSWRKALANDTHQSIEKLAAAVQWNPKVIRKALRLTFLAPDIIEAILRGSQPKSICLSKLQGISACLWEEQRRLLVFPTYLT